MTIGGSPGNSRSNPPDDRDFLAAGGEMAHLIRQKDWSRTPLGAPEAWPQSLRTAVNLCLASSFPINIIWGPQHTQIYNDGYRVVCGEVHPRALGEDYSVTWASAWPVIGESFERALAGEKMYLENQRMFLKRLHGALEETFFTFSHSPIRDENGGIGGLFHPVTETTATMLAERRTRALRDLGASLGAARDERDVARRAVDVLSRFEFDLPFLLYYALDPTSGFYTLASSCGIATGTTASPLRIDAETKDPWPFSEPLRTARILEIEDLSQILRNAPCGPYGEQPKRGFVIPILGPTAAWTPAVIVTGASSRLPFNEAYRSFYDLLSVTIAGALAAVRAREDERRRAEALAEIDRAKTLFFSNVSHEFRTPLTLLLGPLEETLASPSLASGDRERLTISHRNTLRLLKLVNSLLDFSRVQSGRAQANYQPTDLSRLTAELVSNFRSACERAGLRLTVDCPPLAHAVYVDRDMWEKIVLNLVSNAFKFTFEGEIKVSIRSDGTSAVLNVRDTGTGIAESDLPHLFDRFYRVENARGRTHEGTGIGLALVLELVKLHCGSIRVDSIHGAGTVFTVSIPLGAAHLSVVSIDAGVKLPSTATRAAAYVEEALRWLPDSAELQVLDEAPEEIGAVRVGADRSTVLFADDNADMRDYVRHLLDVRYDVETVADGEAALQSARARRPDLLLADIMMPALDGFALLQAWRADPALKEVPVILLSARAGEEAKVEGLDAGADDYLVKPFAARELLARIAANLDLARIRREATQALRSRTARFEMLFNQAPIGVYLIDSDLRICEVNPAALPIFADIPDLIGQKFDAVSRLVWSKADADEIVRLVRRTLETGVSYAAPERIERRRGKGDVEYYEWRISRVALREGGFGVVCYFRDVSAQVIARRRIAESEQRFRALVDASAQIVWSTDAAGRSAGDSSTWQAFTGQSEAEMKGAGWANALHPADRERASEAWGRAVAERAPFQIDFRLRHVSGEWRWVTARATPLFAADGTLSGYVGMNTDITERKRAEEQQRLLLREMSHRVKNLFALTGSLVALSARDSQTPQEMADAVQGRVAALARAHSLILPTLEAHDEAASLHDLVRTVCAPYFDAGGADRIAIEGQDVPIAGQGATSLALVLHELATNASKYGALSSPTGRVHIGWMVERGELLLTWAEHGGPALHGPPETEGFGSTLARRSVEQLEGEISYEWNPEGLIVRISAPVQTLTSPGPAPSP